MSVFQMTVITMEVVMEEMVSVEMISVVVTFFRYFQTNPPLPGQGLT